LGKYVIHCDGSIEGGNPGGWAVGGWIATKEDEVVAYGCHDLGKGEDRTNNMAEYSAVYAAHAWCLSVSSDSAISFKSDSQLIVKQLTGEFRCLNSALKEWCDDIRTVATMLRHRGCEIAYEWVPRAENAQADLVSRILYDPEKYTKKLGLSLDDCIFTGCDIQE